MTTEDRRRRNAMSCDGCRQRKVKCEKLSSGPCHRCGKLGMECRVGGSTTRPYYHTSKERYELLVSVVRHFVPSASFTTEGLRDIVEHLQPPGVETPERLPPQLRSPLNASTINNPLEVPAVSAPLTPDTISSCSYNDTEDRLMVDAMDVPRLNGSSSFTAFNAKVQSQISQNFNSLLPCTIDEAPSSFDGRVISTRKAECLPDRGTLEQAAMAFFEHINSVIYVLDQEQFLLWLDCLYTGQEASTSVLVIVFLVMALCYDAERVANFNLARSYMDDVIEESSLDSVRAVMLMSLYHQRQNQRSVSWILLGVAIRMAQSLGLHQNIGYVQDTSPYRSEAKRRIWWSLCDLDNWTSCMLGRPPGIGCTNQVMPLPSQELNTALFTPPGYATASAALGTILGQISERLYNNQEDPVKKDKAMNELTHKLKGWWQQLPGHLHPESPTTAPSFMRATLYLGLKYNHARMLIGRPYLTHWVLCSKATHGPVFDSRVEICQAANRDSLKILRKLHEHGLLTTSLWFDTYFIICTALILFLRSTKTHSVQEDLHALLPIMRMCSGSDVGKYAAENVEKYLQNVERMAATGCDSDTRIVDLLFRTHDSAQDLASSSPIDMIGGSGSSGDVGVNDPWNTDNIPLDCFDFERDFGLQVCEDGARRALEL